MILCRSGDHPNALNDAVQHPNLEMANVQHLTDTLVVNGGHDTMTLADVPALNHPHGNDFHL